MDRCRVGRLPTTATQQPLEFMTTTATKEPQTASPPPPPGIRAIAGWLTSADSQLPLAIAAGVLLVIGFALHVIVGWWVDVPLLDRAGLWLIWVSLGLGAIHGVQTAWESIRELTPSIDVLMVVGAGLAAGIGHPEEGALLLFMFTLAHALEYRAMNKARDAVSRLKRLMPKSALKKVGRDWKPADAEELIASDVVLVRPGETIPADGVVSHGHSAIDQSTLTGESMPRSVEPGDDVFAGTMNTSGALEVEVSRPVAESSIQKILKLVLEAQERRQPLQRVIDTFSTPYTVTVFAVAFIALLVFLFVWPVLSFADAAYRAITLLVVASPCALVIATPTATLCALSRTARAGVLVKGGDALERLAMVRKVALDKTGTLTTGQIEVTRVEPIAASNVDSLLEMAMAAEQRSTHPIAAAIVRLAESHHVHPAELAELTNVPGRGIEGTFEGQPVRIGRLDFCAEIIPMCFRRLTEQVVDRIRESGGTPVVIAHGGEAIVVALSDQPRPGAAELTRGLRDVGVQTVTMLTGDQRIIAEKLARELGIEDVHAELMPEDKVEYIRKIRSTGEAGGLAVIGDGVNDAPALAVADVGLAMGGIGADAALETADVVLLHDDLDRVPWSIALARRAKSIMYANILFAIGVITVLGALTFVGWVPMWAGVLGHEGSTLIVVANSLRLLAHRDP